MSPRIKKGLGRRPIYPAHVPTHGGSCGHFSDTCSLPNFDSQATPKKYDWIRVSRQNPCPVCKKPDYCQVTDDGKKCKCMRVAEGAYRSYDTGCGLAHYHDLSGGQYNDYVHPSHLKPKKTDKPKLTPEECERLHAEFTRAATESRLSELSERIGVSVESLRVMGTGWAAEQRAKDDNTGAWLQGAWTTPERDAAGAIVGFATRFRGPKKAVPGSRRGMTIAPGWQDSDTVYLVEGASDVAACLDLGLAAIGRPGNTGGNDQLSELLTNYHGRIIVVGERDKKENGTWPGREGAISTASKLANNLGRPIYWALPPGDAKDARVFLNARCGTGQQFTEQLKLT